MLLVQEFLKTSSLTELEAAHGVKHRIHGHKVSLNYNQITARDDDKLSQQCRGLILASDGREIRADMALGETTVLARGFDRFFNLGQPAAAVVDFNNCSFYEKLDGTLIQVYYDAITNERCVATRSVPEADLPIDGFVEHTFRSLFERAFLETTGKEFNSFAVENLCVSTTYMFELTTPLNRVVVPHEDYRITLIGARKNTGQELDPAPIAAELGVPSPTRYHFKHIADMVDFVANRDPLNHEGVVACDHLFRRVKVKNPGYLALHRIKDSVMSSPRGLVELILLEKLDDALPLLPDNVRARGESLRESMRLLAREHQEGFTACLGEATMGSYGSKEHRKAFAIAANRRELWMGPLMDQYSNECGSLIEWLLDKRLPDGSWPSSLLDTVLNKLEKR